MLPKPLISFLSVLFLLGAAQGMFLALLLVGVKRGNRRANRFLALLLLFFSLGLVDSFLSATYYTLHYPFLIGLLQPLMCGYGPLVYFYVRSLTEPRNKISEQRIASHFIPMALVFLDAMPFYLADGQGKAQQLFLGQGAAVIDPVVLVFLVQMSGYLFFSLRLLRVHAKNIRDGYSSVEQISLSWLRSLILLFIVLLALYAFLTVVAPFYEVSRFAFYLYSLLTSTVIYVMGYKGLRQPEILGASPAVLPAGGSNAKGPRSDDPLTTADVSSGTNEGIAGKYRKSALSEEQSEKILARLVKVMEQERPYLDMELTLSALSKMLDVSPHHLSQVINENLKKCFFDYVNEYRVREAKKALLAPAARDLSILGVAMDAGFNSKTAFYSAFKKHTGMTPTQFKKDHAQLPDSSSVQ